MELRPLRTGPWQLTDLRPIHLDAPTVFSCFHCGGGSTMGYKLSGFNVRGGVEIDPEMMGLYRKNFNPSLSYLMGVQEFKNRPLSGDEMELYNLDILDGSPPCSSFSMAGNREKDWGKSKTFREGQKNQVLDDLFFHFIDIAKKLKPRIVVAENVKGLVIGKARWYVKEIFQKFREAGYETQLFLLNSARMGVPQARERTFFIARRNDLKLPPIKLDFNEKPITAVEAFSGLKMEGLAITEQQKFWWSRIAPGDSFSKGHPKGHWFSSIKLHPKKTPPTLLASEGCGFYLWDKPRRVDAEMLMRIQSFPFDYDFGQVKQQYLLGMSVPPFMMQRVSTEILKQWIFPLNKKTPT